MMLGGLAACLALMVAAGPAAAASAPTRPIAPISTNFTLTMKYQTITCKNSILPSTEYLTPDATRVTAVVQGQPTFSGCESYETASPHKPVAPKVEITSAREGTTSGAWGFTTDAAGLHVRPPLFYVMVSYPEYPSCHLKIEGSEISEPIGTTRSGTRISTVPLLGGSGSTAKLTYVAGGGPCYVMELLSEYPGEAIGFSATYEVSPSFVLS